MPQLIYHLDEIARKQQRGILYITFGPYIEPLTPSFFLDDENSEWYWEDYQARKMIINWLDNNNYQWHECGHINWRNGWQRYGYDGRIYLDTPYDVENEKYMLLQEYLENPDGSMKYPDVHFCYLPLETALKLQRSPDEE
ncbi:hypothetical protein KU392_03940 [Advenella alkanexedens]|uniref:Uncharacterized protein n=1 Tax=Advenella alkanexedens TaxID=1481665 RepID=A0ABS6NM06_9BURK|nr:hypothetical protein [Advenella alkanexedens]MBV4396409.1 hypothetical protein [Advenella alkanexedens]